ncbi:MULTISPECIES: hypothetical protein [unclassified Carboxylicivirga]|uniref:hypothetical protein n=1 Tax=Carboxylicivirga TaxID=1628153 RepID=UPI003D33A13C
MKMKLGMLFSAFALIFMLGACNSDDDMFGTIVPNEATCLYELSYVEPSGDNATGYYNPVGLFVDGGNQRAQLADGYTVSFNNSELIFNSGVGYYMASSIHEGSYGSVSPVFVLADEATGAAASTSVIINPIAPADVPNMEYGKDYTITWSGSPISEDELIVAHLYAAGQEKYKPLATTSVKYDAEQANGYTITFPNSDLGYFQINEKYTLVLVRITEKKMPVMPVEFSPSEIIARGAYFTAPAPLTMDDVQS